MAPQYTDPLQAKVAEFHHVFGHPDGILSPGQIEPALGKIRVEMLRSEGVEELQEAIDLRDAAEVVDAIIDTNYFAYGTLVIMGQQFADGPTGYPAGDAVDILDALSADFDLVDRYATLFDELEIAFDDPSPDSAVEVLHEIIRTGTDELIALGYDPVEFFDEVHASNMSKLGADGKAILSRGHELDGAPLGKVIKGPNYFVADVAGIYERQRRQGGLAPITGVDVIARKRAAQLEQKGYGPENDARYVADELPFAAAAYLGAVLGDPDEAKLIWPFPEGTFKPVETRLDLLAKAGALIAAEIDRHLAEDSPR